jgi:hypothetical protein
MSTDDKDKNILATILDATRSVASGLGTAADKLMEDGTLKAAAVQGIDELGTALKAFPDAVQAQSVGTVWHPLASQMAKERGVFDREGHENAFEKVMQTQDQVRPERSQSDDRDGLGR